MKVQGIHLVWVVVSDIKTAIEFYTKTIGLTLKEFNDEYGWAELSGPDGCTLGLAQQNPSENMKPGSNAVTTLTVDDLETAKNELIRKKCRLIGETLEVPGHVKMQTFADVDGNMLQLCQLLASPALKL